MALVTNENRKSMSKFRRTVGWSSRESKKMPRACHQNIKKRFPALQISSQLYCTHNLASAPARFALSPKPEGLSPLETGCRAIAIKRLDAPVTLDSRSRCRSCSSSKSPKAFIRYSLMFTGRHFDTVSNARLSGVSSIRSCLPNLPGL